jgi:hypothetical protein
MMDRSQALGGAPSNADAARDLPTAVSCMLQALSNNVVQVAGVGRGRPRVHAMHKQLVAAMLAVCVAVASAGPALAQGGTTGASGGIPLWMPPAAYAPPPAPVHHRQRGRVYEHRHGYGWHRNDTIERH